jgi:putative ABC transport system permease protein
VPRPLPVVSTHRLPSGSTIVGYDTHPAPVKQTVTVSTLPRLGTDGTMVDLEYADRASTDAGPARHPQVWLGAAAPPDALSRLTRQGLVVTDDVNLATARSRLAAQGPALAVWFHLLAGILAIILAVGGLGLIASIDSRSRTADLAALRVQGLSARATRRAVVSAYPVLALAAGVLGLLTALIAWRLTGWALPVFGEDHPPLSLPVWPDPLVLGGGWLAVVAVLVLAALITGRSTGDVPGVAASGPPRSDGGGQGPDRGPRDMVGSGHARAQSSTVEER